MVHKEVIVRSGALPGPFCSAGGNHSGLGHSHHVHLLGIKEVDRFFLMCMLHII